MRPLEHLSKIQRRTTPLPFARYLVNEVSRLFCCDKVAVLWVEPKSLYWRLWPEVEMWGIGRDARKYTGPWPVICHPPCGPWGNYKSKSHESKEHGIIAMQLVHKFGGVVEHPLGSSLFKDYGKGGEVQKIMQSDYGHQSHKATLLYWVKNPSKEQF